MRVNAVILSFNGHVEVAKLLLENRADITVANNEGVTPVITASLSGLQIWKRRVVATAVSCCVMVA
jgi:ankyrin repeat protein